MNKTCKDFGEVLVALGQGKIVVDKEGHYAKVEDNRLVRSVYSSASSGKCSSLGYAGEP